MWATNKNDAFIITCAKVDGEFVNMKSGEFGCYLKDPIPYDEHPTVTQILFDKKDKVIINSYLEINNVTTFGFDKRTFKIFSKNAELNIGYDSIGGIIK